MIVEDRQVEQKMGPQFKATALSSSATPTVVPDASGDGLNLDGSRFNESNTNI